MMKTTLRNACALLAIALPCSASLAQTCAGVWSDAFAWGGASGNGLEIDNLIVFDDGSGPALFAASDRSFTAGGAVVGAVVKFDGNKWSVADGGLTSPVMDFEIYDDGSGPRLYASTWQAVNRWVEGNWEPVGDFTQVGELSELEVFDDGSGPALFAGKGKWDGRNWTQLGNRGLVMAAVNDGPASQLYSVYEDELSRLDNGTFTRLRLGEELTGTINTMIAHDDGSGMMLYAGGNFDQRNLANANNIARFDGTQWLEVGSGLPDEVTALAQSPIDGSLIAFGGPYNGPGFIARWDGTSWEMIEEHLRYGLATTAATGNIGDGNQLYFGGDFDNTSYWPGPPLSYLAMWDGQAIFPIGNGLEGYKNPGSDFPAMAFEVHDDGSGEALYVGGSSQWAGQVPVNGVARWDGQSWSALDTEFEDTAYVKALEVADLRTGKNTLLAALRRFDNSNSLIHVIEQWDGTRWHQIAQANSDILTLRFVPDGPFAGLYAGGRFTEINSVQADYLAKLDIATGQWTSVNAGLNDRVYDIVLLENASETALYICGQFTIAGGTFASGLARWTGSQWQGIPITESPLNQSMEVYDVGNGPQLFIAGYKSTYWDGANVVAISDRSGAVAGFDDGSGPAVYFYTGNKVERWDGKTLQYLPMQPKDLSSHSHFGRAAERITMRGQTSLFFGGPITHVAPYPYALTEKRISSGYIAQYLGCGGSCYADCDHSTGVGTLDVFDFLCFQSAFVATDPYACLCDMSTGPRTCDIFDFLCFQNAFVSGCP